MSTVQITGPNGTTTVEGTFTIGNDKSVTVTDAAGLIVFYAVAGQYFTVGYLGAPPVIGS